MKGIMKVFLRAVLIFAAFSLVCCKGGGSIEMGPAEVVEAFNKAITAGDFDQAGQLCDTLSMSDYLESYREAWITLQKEDSTALSIAGHILNNAVIEVEEVRKDGDSRIVIYSLAADGHNKSKKALVKKEEGAWRVKRITVADYVSREKILPAGS